MALGLDYTDGGQNFLPFIAYNAESGRIFRVEREADGRKSQTDITKNFKAIFDFENVQVGWLNFGPRGSTTPPQFILSQGKEGKPPRPNPDFRECVRIVVQLAKDCGGDYREFTCSSYAARRGLDNLDDLYKEGLKTNPGKLPIVVLEDVIPQEPMGKLAKMTYLPLFKIIGWKDRPDDFIPNFRASNVGDTTKTASLQPPETGSTQVDNSVRVSSPILNEDDFG